MRAFVFVIVGAASACATKSAGLTPDASATDASLDAALPDAGCGAPAIPYPVDCRLHGLATFDLEGSWHMAGSSTYQYGSGSANTGPIDETVAIHRDGCSAGFGSGSSAPPVTPKIHADDTALTYACSYEPGCSRGMASWSICIRDFDGALRYWERSYGFITGQQWIEESLAYLTR